MKNDQRRRLHRSGRLCEASHFSRSETRLATFKLNDVEIDLIRRLGFDSTQQRVSYSSTRISACSIQKHDLKSCRLGPVFQRFLRQASTPVRFPHRSAHRAPCFERSVSPCWGHTGRSLTRLRPNYCGFIYHRRAQSELVGWEQRERVGTRLPRNLWLPLLCRRQYAAVFGGFAAHFEIAIRFECDFANGALGSFLVAIVCSHDTDNEGTILGEYDS
jgi:hypothetical protein